MGNTFEIWSWLPINDDQYDYFIQWSGEVEEEAFSELKRLKATGLHPCLRFFWR